MKNSKKEPWLNFSEISTIVILLVYVGLLAILGSATFKLFGEPPIPAPAPRIYFEPEPLPLIAPDILAEQPVLDPFYKEEDPSFSMEELRLLVEEEVQELEKKYLKN